MNKLGKLLARLQGKSPKLYEVILDGEVKVINDEDLIVICWRYNFDRKILRKMYCNYLRTV